MLLIAIGMENDAVMFYGGSLGISNSKGFDIKKKRMKIPKELEDTEVY